MEFHRFLQTAVLVLSLSLLSLLPFVTGHARLLYPPSRASMWRLGFQANKDYNDNQGFCGGKDVMHKTFNGKCGVCGDPWSPLPRPHERGGQFYTGTVTALFNASSIITAEVQVTANHKGFFEFRVCAYDKPEPSDIETRYDGSMIEVTQSCLDKNLLQLENGQGTKYFLPPGNGHHKIRLRLPSHLSCEKCLFQWRYKTGNSWGTDKDGKSCVGCGEQEEFKACADIIIDPHSKTKAKETTGSSETGTTRSSETGTTRSSETGTTRSSETGTTRSSETGTTRSSETGTTRSSETGKTGSSETETTGSSETGKTGSSHTKMDTTFKIDFFDTTNKNNGGSRKSLNSTTSEKWNPTTPNNKGFAGNGLKCEPTFIYSKVPGMKDWCYYNCNQGFCPATHCICTFA